MLSKVTRLIVKFSPLQKNIICLTVRGNDFQIKSGNVVEILSLKRRCFVCVLREESFTPVLSLVKCGLDVSSLLLPIATYLPFIFRSCMNLNV